VGEDIRHLRGTPGLQCETARRPRNADENDLSSLPRILSNGVFPPVDFSDLMNQIPLSALFVLTILYVAACIYVGMAIGVRVAGAPDGKESIGSVVGATLGLLAFMLAFTFNMTANRYEARKQLLLQEVNSIGTTFLRAGMLPQPHEERARTLLREYVDLRVGTALDPSSIESGVARSEAIHDELWSGVEDMVANGPVTIAQSLFIQSLNQTIDLHSMRVTVGSVHRIPGAIWFGLYAVAGLAMIAVGYQSANRRLRQLLIDIMLGLAFSSVILLIADLDRYWEGTVTIDPQPMIELQRKMNTAP